MRAAFASWASITGGGLFLFFGLPGVLTIGLRARSLRVLPWSSTRLAIVIIGMRLLYAVAAWIALTMLYVIAAGAFPDTLRLDLLSVALTVAAIGSAGVVACGRIGGYSQTVSVIVGMATALAILVLRHRVGPAAYVAMLLSGPLLIGVAVVAHRWLLLNGSRLYRQPSRR